MLRPQLNASTTGATIARANPPSLALTPDGAGAILASDMGKTFWTTGRRRALSAASLTLFQVLVGGAVVGGVMGRLELWLKAAFVASILLVFVIGIVAAPDNGGGK